MHTIYKYQLRVTDAQTISLPKHAVVLDIQEQHGILCMWCIVNPSKYQEDHTIRIFGTGHQLPSDLSKFNHLATVQQSFLVWHIFCDTLKRHGQ